MAEGIGLVSLYEQRGEPQLDDVEHHPHPTPADCFTERPLSALPGEPKFLPPSRAAIGSWQSSSFGEWKGVLPAYIVPGLRDQSRLRSPKEAR